jgi:glycosyltransferase 2 family protein
VVLGSGDPFGMTLRSKLLASLGALGLVVLLWRIDLNAVKLSLLHVGWGMALVLNQEIVAHALNGWAWRFAFTPESARRVSLGELIRLRVAGDAINYLTPTATIGGEVARTMLLSDAYGVEARAVSVVTAKATQTLAQAFFISAGLIFIAEESIRIATARWVLAGAGVGVVAVILIAWHLAARCGGMVAAWRRVVGAGLVGFVWSHPDRVALSTLLFALAYAWGAVEAYWICRFLLHPVPPATAFAIEVLSITIDGLLFVVPAKIGTQEGGKVVAFAALGLPGSLGFAFGIIRHVRELVWAAAGILIYCLAIRRGTSSAPRELIGDAGTPAAP